MAKSNQPKLPSRSHQQVLAEQQRLADEERRQRLIRWVTIAAGVGILLSIIVGAIYGVTRGDSAGDIPINGQPLTDFDPASGTDQAIGSKAPLFHVADAQRHPTLFGGGGGPNDTAKVIMLVDEDCGSCDMSIDAVSDWNQSNSVPDGVELVAVVTGSPTEDARTWVGHLGWNHTVHVDDSANTIADNLGLDLDRDTGWIVLTNNNVLVHRSVGEADVDKIAELVATATST